MDRFVKNFILMSIIYLLMASFLGILMLWDPGYLVLKFPHSHLMLLGWVSMMIYGVGYHILPRFAGRPLKSRKMAELQFWLANIGLVGMTGFYVLVSFYPAKGLMRVSAIFGIMEVVSIGLFFYNILGSVFAKQTPSQ